MNLPSCPHWEIDPHQIFPWVRVCRWFMGCSGCRLDEIEVCRCQGLRVEEEAYNAPFYIPKTPR